MRKTENYCDLQTLQKRPIDIVLIKDESARKL